MKLFTSLLLAASLATTSVQAAPLLDATDAERILQLARGFGSASLGEDDIGDPLITGRIEGSKYGIYFYGCDDNHHNCNELQFSAGWADVEVALSDINEWNKTRRFGKAYLDEENDPILEFSVNLEHGVTPDNFDSTLDWWASALKEFKEYIGE